MCEQSGVSRSGYYAYRSRKAKPSQSEIDDCDDFEVIKAVYDFKGRPKGSREIAMLMPKLCHGKRMNRKKIRRLMRKFGLVCPIRKANPLKRMAKALATNSVFSNKLNRQFKVGVPGAHLLTDISYIFYGSHGDKRCYLSAVKDASSNEIVARELSETIDMPFVMRMLRKLDAIGWMPESVLIHSDQGCHYTSLEYRRFLSSKGICQSMSRRGNCWDNAPMESFFGHAKDELRLRSCETFDDVSAEMESYMDYYNNWRPQSGLGGMTPAEYREYLLKNPPKLPAVIWSAKKDGCGSASIF